MSIFRASDETNLRLIESQPDFPTFISDRSDALANLPFGERQTIVRRIADSLDAKISTCAEKYEDYDLFVDSVGKCLVVGTALWHPRFLCREYIAAVVNAIAEARASDAYVVTNHFEYYADVAKSARNVTELKFDFAITSDTIAVASITSGEFLRIVDRAGDFGNVDE